MLNKFAFESVGLLWNSVFDQGLLDFREVAGPGGPRCGSTFAGDPSPAPGSTKWVRREAGASTRFV